MPTTAQVCCANSIAASALTSASMCRRHSSITSAPAASGLANQASCRLNSAKNPLMNAIMPTIFVWRPSVFAWPVMYSAGRKNDVA